MYRNACQRGLLTVFYGGGAKPLNIWDVRTQDGYITRFLDQEIKAMVLEIGGTNVSTSYMTCPKGNAVLGISMPFLVMVVKNLHKYFSFEVTILDDTGTRRRFRASNFQSTTQILPLCTVMPIGLSEGWNQIQFNLSEFTRRSYKKQYVETQKLKVNANIRIRRIYFAERLLPDDELPADYKLYFPLKYKPRKSDAKKGESEKENVVPSTSLPAPGEEKKGSQVDVARVASKVGQEEQMEKAPSTRASRTSIHSTKTESRKSIRKTSKEGEVIDVTEGEEMKTVAGEATTVGETTPGGEATPVGEATTISDTTEGDAGPPGEETPIGEATPDHEDKPAESHDENATTHDNVIEEAPREDAQEEPEQVENAQ